MKNVKLTDAEINHIAHLIEMNEREGVYYGNKKQYWERSDRLKKLLLFDVITSVCKHEYITDADWKSQTCSKCNHRIYPYQTGL